MDNGGRVEGSINRDRVVDVDALLDDFLVELLQATQGNVSPVRTPLPLIVLFFFLQTEVLQRASFDPP